MFNSNNGSILYHFYIFNIEKYCNLEILVRWSVKVIKTGTAQLSRYPPSRDPEWCFEAVRSAILATA